MRGSNELKAAALTAPYIAKRGKLIAGQTNHENTGTATLTYAAPAVINDMPVNVGLAIQFSNDRRPRAVNIETENGGVFKLKAPQGLGSRADKSQVTALPTRGASVTDTVAQEVDTVKKIWTRSSLIWPISAQALLTVP